jgi:hypothetical protein
MRQLARPSVPTPVKAVIAIGCGMIVFLSLYPAILAFLFISYKWEQRAASVGITNSIPIGDAIIVQLEAYKSINGNYPEKLEDLVTAGLLPVIEHPTWGERRWRYGLREDGSFYLVSTNKDSYPIMSYDSSDGDWFTDT